MSQVRISDTPVGIRQMANKKDKGRQPTRAELTAMGNRLRWFRVASGNAPHGRFVKGTSISRTTYVGYEGGYARIGLDSALELIEKYPDLSLDYIYLGRTGAIPNLELQLAIRNLMESEA